jgi:hypothetical protein
MKDIEGVLWNYIDGNCSESEQKVIRQLIDSDVSVRTKYVELLALNSEFAAIELDEPSMAFTYNVMEVIRMEQAQVPLKTTINKKIIIGIAIFFGATILTLLVFTFLNINWNEIKTSPALSTTFKLPNFKSYVSKPLIEGFLFFDVVLALFLLDSYLRKRNFAKSV